MTVARTDGSHRAHTCVGSFRGPGRRAARLFAALGLVAFLWTWSLAGAAAAERSPTPAPVKYYLVPRSGQGPVTLIGIASQTLGTSSRFMQIFRLNKGRLQPNGGRLENPGVIEPGWVLQLPPDARGPGVRFGQLPGPSPSASAKPSAPHASAPAAASSYSVAGLAVTMLAIVIAGALAVLGLRLFRPRRRRRKHAVVVPGRGHQHARIYHPVPRDEVPARHDANPPDWSWPPSMVTPADMPADHPSRPQWAVDQQGWPADHPSRPQRAVDQQGWPAARGRGPRPVPAGPAGFAGPPLTWAGHAPAPHHAPALPPPVSGYVQPVGPPAGQRSAGPRARDLGPSDALRVARMLLSEAEAEAYKIRADANAVRDEATTQAATLLEAAERDAAKIRASLRAMSTELNDVAALVTQRLTVPDEAEPRTEATAAPPQPRQPSTPPPPRQAVTETRPGTRRKPRAPAALPGERPRQLRAARIVVAATAALLLAGAASGATELILHGAPFFVFRSAGTGGTPGSGLEEDQGPGQPNAPGAHHRNAGQHRHKHNTSQTRHHTGGSAH